MIFTDVVGSSATKRDVSLGRDNRDAIKPIQKKFKHAISNWSANLAALF